MADDPFATLGLPARADLPDEEVRAAWKRIAAATHPDRDDGGDAARYAAAAAAYDTLRTSFGRGEALADLGLAGAWARAWPRSGPRSAARHARRTRARGPGVRVGPGWRLVSRVTAAAAVLVTCVLAAGWTPGTVGLLAGLLTWVGVTGRHDVRGRGVGLAGGLAGGDGAGGAGNPVRPGAHVEGGGEAGQREGEDLVGRGDARAAVGGHRTVAGRAEGRETGGQVGRRLEGPVRVDVLGRRGADRAWDVARHRVDVLGLAPVPLTRPGVEQQAGPAMDAAPSASSRSRWPGRAVKSPIAP